MRESWRAILGFTLVGSFLGGCGGGGTMPSARIASAQAAIRAAQEVGATRDPRATLHLRLAQEQFDDAQRLVREEDYEPATMLLRRSEADAELALALARQHRAEADAAVAENRVRELRGSHR